MVRRRVSTASACLTQWIGPADQGYISVASGGATLIAFTSFEARAIAIRTRGMCSVQPTVFTADLTLGGAVGMAVVSTEAFVAGIASIPTPFTDADWHGWMVWRSFTYRLEQADNTTGRNFPDWNFEIDSKAMRKVSSNETLVIIAESQAGAFQISTPWRVLIKLS